MEPRRRRDVRPVLAKRGGSLGQAAGVGRALVEHRAAQLEGVYNPRFPAAPAHAQPPPKRAFLQQEALESTGATGLHSRLSTTAAPPNSGPVLLHTGCPPSPWVPLTRWVRPSCPPVPTKPWPTL